MLKKVAFAKAMLAGAAGAVAWEAVARAYGLVFGELPFDLVRL